MENDTLWHSTNSGGISARLNEAIEELDGVKALTNDITVVPVCDTNQAALQDCRQKNIKLNKDKADNTGQIAGRKTQSETGNSLSGVPSFKNRPLPPISDDLRDDQLRIT